MRMVLLPVHELRVFEASDSAVVWSQKVLVRHKAASAQLDGMFTHET